MDDLSDTMSGDSSFTNDTLGNVTLSCLATTLQTASVLPFSTALVIAMRILQVVVFFTFATFGSVLNGLFLYLFYKHKKLQTPSFAVALQIAVLNLLLSLVLYTSLAISSVTDRLLQVEAVCAFLGFFLYLAIPLRVSLIFVLVVDRFLLVFAPFWYPKKETKFVVAFSLLSYGVMLLVSILFLPGVMDCIGYSEISRACSVNYVCGLPCQILHRVQAMIYGLLSIVPVFLYGCLYHKARKIGKEPAANIGDSTSKRQWKATITFFLLFLTLSIVTWPGIVLSIVSRSLPLSPASYVLNSLRRFLFALLVITDPIVLMRNSDVKEALQLLKEKFGRGYRN